MKKKGVKMNSIGLFHYLILAVILFITGMIGACVSRNMIRIVMSLFLVSVSVIINFLSFGAYGSGLNSGANVMSVFVLVVTILQISAVLALFLKVYHSNEYLDVEKIKDKEN